MTTVLKRRVKQHMHLSVVIKIVTQRWQRQPQQQDESTTTTQQQQSTTGIVPNKKLTSTKSKPTVKNIDRLLERCQQEQPMRAIKTRHNNRLPAQNPKVKARTQATMRLAHQSQQRQRHPSSKRQTKVK